MLLPISHEKMTVRRLPVVTITLVALTIVAFVLTSAMGPAAVELFGYVPDHPAITGIFTYMFVHADVLHVAGNMWFLFLCGLSLEDRWGRLPFAVYYVVAGVVAAGVHHLATSEPSAALIGASGAVAGAMGAFLVLFATAKIRFIGLLGFRPTSFEAPAYVMLPLWAIVELLYGLVFRSSGTSHWAHVGGFAFGLAVAGAFRLLGVDRRLDDAAERAAVLGDDPRVDAARALVTKGEARQAVALLEGLAKEKPGSVHVQLALREAEQAAGSTPTIAARPPVELEAAAPFFPPAADPSERHRSDRTKR